MGISRESTTSLDLGIHIFEDFVLLDCLSAFHLSNASCFKFRVTWNFFWVVSCFLLGFHVFKELGFWFRFVSVLLAWI